MNAHRKYAQGAEVISAGVSFRIWAPEHRRVEVFLFSRGETFALEEEPEGFWSATVDRISPGERYAYRLDGDSDNLPDPAARFLPEGPDGPAEVVSPSAFAWTDQNWQGRAPGEQVLYELHVGTFSPEGTWAGLEAKLPLLAELGVTTLELMPVAEFAGKFGWGYDGVAWFAPSHLYGTPDDFRRCVDRAHALRLGVILDVVYNHFGASGNYSGKFSRYYLGALKTEWGMGLNYDGEHAHAMRALTIDNAAYWIDEYHLDGLRLDATQAIEDHSQKHIITELAGAARSAARGRKLLLVAENEPQDTRLLRAHDEPGVGAGLDALWNDDFQHSAKVALTGRRQAYYTDYTGQAVEWLTAVKQGFLYQGQRSEWQEKPRGRPTVGLPMSAFVAFLENHDQVANSVWNNRLWQQASPGQFRAMTALLLLGPWIPFLFQGQEWNASAPFCYFAGHEGKLADLVRRGRTEFLSQFPGCASDPDLIKAPEAVSTFTASRLDWTERAAPRHAAALRLHRDLLRLRREDPALSSGARLETAALAPACGLVRYYVPQTSELAAPRDRILLVNLGAGLELPTTTEPLLAPPSSPRAHHWSIAWSSEAPAYGGDGCLEPDSAKHAGWLIPGCATLLLSPAASVLDPSERA